MSVAFKVQVTKECGNTKSSCYFGCAQIAPWKPKNHTQVYCHTTIFTSNQQNGKVFCLMNNFLVKNLDDRQQDALTRWQRKEQVDSIHVFFMQVPKFCFHLSVECIGFVWQGSCSGTSTGVVSVRSCQKIPPCPIQPMPAGSCLDPSLAKADPSEMVVVSLG